MRKKKPAPLKTEVPPQENFRTPPPIPIPPVVERLPERYRLNTVMQRYGKYAEDTPAVLTEEEARELMYGLFDALYPGIEHGEA